VRGVILRTAVPGWPKRTPRYGWAARIFNLFAGVLAAALYAAAAAADDPKLVVAFGDSLSAGYGLSEADAFPAQLEGALAALGVTATVVNAGVSGDTTAGGLARLDWTLPEAADLVIVELGSNDGLRGLDPEKTGANLDAILTRLDERGFTALLAGMLAPPNLGPEYGATFNAIYPALAEKHDVVLYPFFLDGVAAVPALNQADGIHPNVDGVAIIVERLAPYVVEALARGQAGGGT